MDAAMRVVSIGGALDDGAGVLFPCHSRETALAVLLDRRGTIRQGGLDIESGSGQRRSFKNSGGEHRPGMPDPLISGHSIDPKGDISFQGSAMDIIGEPFAD